MLQCYCNIVVCWVALKKKKQSVNLTDSKSESKIEAIHGLNAVKAINKQKCTIGYILANRDIPESMFSKIWIDLTKHCLFAVPKNVVLH